MANLRSEETVEQSSARRAQNQERMASRRSQETVEQSLLRRGLNQERMADLRSEETVEQAAARRARDQERTSERRAGEHVVPVGDFHFSSSSGIVPRTWLRLGGSYDCMIDYGSLLGLS